ncbi:MAG TPA: hypothetical protein VK083_02205 [Nocardia sp.]|uniref:hypothetical protein n=1 Tax=Nocardia sp. TaxID=1821 RepID=UPI002B4B1992|nr:hypothetical protein [Nocardia sp.]HLS75588.1 hypothetical protein [Nocardia sp.]
MIVWLTALLVWMAVGARIGRVLVRPATTSRVAIVVAVSSVGAAATVAVPEIALALDNLRPSGLPPGSLSDGTHLAAWISFATATSVVAAAAWPVVSRRNLRQIALLIYGIGALAILASLLWSFTAGWMVLVPTCAFIVLTGVRNLDWTTLGRGIAIYATGAAVVGAQAALRAWRGWNGEGATEYGAPQWAWPLWSAASALIALGAVWVVVELWARARRTLRETRTLHRTMLERFPEVIAHEQPSSSTQLRASDQIAQIMDALYLQSGSGVELIAAGPPPADVGERAERVARWARNPLGETVVDARWIAPPEGISPRGWVRAIARAFDESDEELLVPGAARRS